MLVSIQLTVEAPAALEMLEFLFSPVGVVLFIKVNLDTKSVFILIFIALKYFGVSVC